MEPAHIEETGDMFVHSTSCFLYRKLPFKVLCYGEQIKICVDVAAKIRGRVFSSEAAVFRVLKELQICRFLQRNCHPNIVEYLGVARPNCLFDFNQVTILYRSYQLSLEVFINQKKERGESLNIDLLKAIMAGVLSALHHLHSHGIIHSNVKANSILLTENLEVKLAGLASCKISRDRHRSDCYRLNAREFGADPPELILGVPMVKGQPVDIFATGCLFYWLATGQPLFPCDPWVRDSVLLKVLQFQKLETVPTEEEIQRLELSVDWKYKMVEMRRKVLQERSFDSHGLERLFNDPGFCGILRCMLGFIASQRPTAERLLRQNFFKEVSSGYYNLRFYPHPERCRFDLKLETSVAEAKYAILKAAFDVPARGSKLKFWFRLMMTEHSRVMNGQFPDLVQFGGVEERGDATALSVYQTFHTFVAENRTQRNFNFKDLL